MVIWEEELNIRKLIELSENEGIFLPEFQRPFIWEDSQIKLLIDSIYNNYTINSILLWEGEDELARRRVGGSIKEIKIPRGTSERITYLLDGQQRATALMFVFTTKPVYRGNRIRKFIKANLYFDSEYTGEEPEMRFIFGDEPIKKGSEEIFLDELTSKEIFEHFKTRFINLKDVYYSDTKTIKEKIGNSDLFADYILKMQELKEHILNRKVYDIKQKGDLKTVLDVFERINTQNTKLNMFDIMVAKTYKMLNEKEYFSLRKYLDLIRYQGEIKKDYLENIRLDIPENTGEIDDVTLIFLIMVILKRKFKQKEVLKISTNELIENLKYVRDTYIRSIQQTERYKIELSELSKFKPIFKFIVAYLSENKSIGIKEKKFLDKWFWNTLLYNRYPGAQNERVEVDFKITKENNDEKAIEFFKKGRTRNFDSNWLDAYYAESGQLYNALFVLLLNNHPKDLNSGIPVSDADRSSDKLEEHHIFPQNSKIGKQISEKYRNDQDSTNLMNNIANILLITKNTNNRIIKNKNPSEYITKFEAEYKKHSSIEEFYKIMKSQFINKEMIEMLKEDKFEEFVKARTQLIKERIKELCD